MLALSLPLLPPPGKASSAGMTAAITTRTSEASVILPPSLYLNEVMPGPPQSSNSFGIGRNSNFVSFWLWKTCPIITRFRARTSHLVARYCCMSLKQAQSITSLYARYLNINKQVPPSCTDKCSSDQRQNLHILKHISRALLEIWWTAWPAWIYVSACQVFAAVATAPISDRWHPGVPMNYSYSPCGPTSSSSSTSPEADAATATTLCSPPTSRRP